MKRSIGILILLSAVFTSCEKQHRVRVSNFYVERIDSVIVGSHAVTFTDILPESTTDYQNVTSGKHSVRFVTASGRTFHAMAPLAKNEGGDHTIQIDGLEQVIVLPDDQ